MKVQGEYKWRSAIVNELDSVIGLRRKLHQIPELGFQENETSKLLQAFIKDVPNIELKTGIAETGFTATLGSEKPGRCIAFRADMDALPILETTGLSYASQSEGRMHACGHDGHSAILAGLVRVLGQYQDELKGPVKFIFQPAEEGGGGAERMVKSGVLEAPKVDALFGLHGWPSLAIAQVGVMHGPFFACTNSFEIRIEGRSGHAAFPHDANDPMPIAAAIILSAQTLVSRATNPLESAVLSICQVEGGNTYNVIPEQVVMRGTLRCFSQSHRVQTLQKLKTMVESIAVGFGAKAFFEMKNVAYPVLINDEEETAYFKEVATLLLGSDSLQPVTPTMGGEDFAFYAQKVPSCFWLLGVKDPVADSWPLLHTSKYDFNDAALEYGIALQSEVALRFQERP